jgi:hypothetical protein
VVALFRKELERNTDEEALYGAVCEYLNQHRFFNEEMETYQQAINRFNKAAWYDKLARWYLRQKRQDGLCDAFEEVCGCVCGNGAGGLLSGRGDARYVPTRFMKS